MRLTASSASYRNHSFHPWLASLRESDLGFDTVVEEMHYQGCWNRLHWIMIIWKTSSSRCIEFNRPQIPIKNLGFNASLKLDLVKVGFKGKVHQEEPDIGKFSSTLKVYKYFTVPSVTSANCKLIIEGLRKLCRSLHKYWTSVFATLCFQITLESCPLTALYEDLPVCIRLSKFKSDFVAFLCLVPLHLILIHWKKSHPPSHAQRIQQRLCRCFLS